MSFHRPSRMRNTSSTPLAADATVCFCLPFGKNLTFPCVLAIYQPTAYSPMEGEVRTHMSQKFYQVMISSELRTQGLRLLELLIAKRLIFGGPVFNGPARFLWKNEIVEHDYCWTITFTPQDLRDELIKAAEKESAEAICMIT